MTDAPSGWQQRNEWKDRVIDALVVNWAYKAEHEDDPKKAVDALIIAEIQMATDPMISLEMYNALKAAFGAGWDTRTSQREGPNFDPVALHAAWESYYEGLQKK